MARLFLADTSAWHRSDHPAVEQRWREEALAGRLAVTGPMRLEVLYSARNSPDLQAIREDLDALVRLPAGDEAFVRAEEVQGLLAERGGLHHRSVKITDLVIAAAAELGGATVWHYDADYDRVASVTGQPCEWIVPRGSI
jgi:predicted nucleic acid-binding protein